MTETRKYQLDELSVPDILSYLNARVSDMEESTRRERKQVTKAVDVIEGLMRFCRCFAQHHTEDIRYKEAEQFLKEVEDGN